MDQSGICLFFFSSFTTTTEGHYPSAVSTDPLYVFVVHSAVSTDPLYVFVVHSAVSTDPLYVFVVHSAMNLVDLQWLEVIVQRGF